MSDLDGEDLSDDTIQDLKLKGLYGFVLFDQSMNSAIKLMVYENEKYRPIVREWGSAVGIHLFPPLDRRPFSDDLGKNSVSGPLSEIEPIKGYKWQGEWTILVENGVTDAHGFQYARGWSTLTTEHKLSDKSGRLSFVRRRRWTRVMMVDPDPPLRRLPFELEIKILDTTLRTMTAVNSIEAYIDTLFNDELHSSTFLSPKQGNVTTTSAGGASGTASTAVGGTEGNNSMIGNTATNCSTTIIRPMHSLDPAFKVSFVVHRKKMSSSGISTAGRVDLELAQFMDQINQGPTVLEQPIAGASGRYLHFSIEIREQKLFTISKVNFFSQVKQNAAIPLEAMLSSRLRERIVVVGLAVESDCKGLMDAICGYLREGESYITELDLFDVIDDINQMCKRSNFSKLIMLLQDSDHPLKSVTPYPLMHGEWCVFSKLVNIAASATGGAGLSPLARPGGNGFLPLSRRQSMRAATALSQASASYFQQVLEDTMRHNDELYRLQPVQYRDHTPGLLKTQPDAVEVGNITPGLRAYRLVIHCQDGVQYDLIWGSFFEYIMALKLFSLLKYEPASLENARYDGPWKLLAYQPSPDVNVSATFHMNAQTQSFFIATDRDSEVESVTINFDEIEYVEVACSHHLSMKYLLEINILSLQAPLLRYMLQNRSFIELDTADGQTFRIDLNGNKADTYRMNSSSSFPINEYLRVLIPEHVANSIQVAAALAAQRMGTNSSGLDDFLHITIQTNGTWEEANATDITQRTAAQMASSDMEASQYYPTLGSSAVGGGLSGSGSSFNKAERPTSSSRSFSKRVFGGGSSSMNSSFSGGSSLRGGDDREDHRGGDKDGDSRGGGMGGGGRPGPPVNRTVVRLCYRMPVPLSALASTANNQSKSSSVEQESQLTLLKLNSSWKLRVFKIEGQRRTNDFNYVYFVAYIATATGDIIPYNGPHTNIEAAAAAGEKSSNAGSAGKTSKVDPTLSPGRQKSGGYGAALAAAQSGIPPSSMGSYRESVSGGNGSLVGTPAGNVGSRTGFIHVSHAVPCSGSASWTDADLIEFSTEKHGDVLFGTKHLLVQFWIKIPNGTDSPIGETLIPLASARRERVDTAPAPVTLDTASPHRIILPAVLNARKSVPASQAVNTGMQAVCHFTCTDHNQVDEYDSSDRASVKVKMSLKPLQSADCSWPCHFLHPESKYLEVEPFHFSPAHDGLYIFCTPPEGTEKKRHASGVGSILAECAERRSATVSPTRIQLVIPYSQVSALDMHILTDNMLLVSVTLKRVMKFPNGATTERPVHKDILIGPCLAKDLYTIMHNRISLFKIRSTLEAYATADKRTEEIEAFDKVAKLLQDEILDTMIKIDQYSQLKSITGGPRSTERGSTGSEGGNTSAENSYSNRSGAADEQSHLFPLKLLYLKKAALKIYLWFLVEQTKLNFGPRSSYANSSWIMLESGQDGQESKTLLEDPDALMQRISDLMDQLERDVRLMMFQAHKQHNTDISNELSAVVYDKYLKVIKYLMSSIELDEKIQKKRKQFNSERTGRRSLLGNSSSNAGNDGDSDDEEASPTGEKIYKKADPQKKRDLIKFIIIHDNIFEVALNSTLRPHDYHFSLPPLLSMCLDFERLIETFAYLVNENILLWNARTFEHFRQHKEPSSVFRNQDVLPWGVTAFVDLTTQKELFISGIPETIQTQMNVEIGLKKVPLESFHATMGAASLNSIYLLNQKISAAISRVYLALASEYERVLNKGVQFLWLKDSQSGRMRPLTSANDKDEPITFLISIINDCHRMITKHIPDSINSFMEEADQQMARLRGGKGGDGEDDEDDGDEDPEDGGNRGALAAIMDQSCMQFLASSRAMEAVSQNAVNHLSNQIFFYTELRNYFLLSFDSHMTTSASSASQNSKLKGRAGSILAEHTVAAQTHTPIAVICATLRDFFRFVSMHLNGDDIEKLLFVCIKKVILRYLVFLRDLVHLLPAPGKDKKKKDKKEKEKAKEKEKEEKTRSSLGGNSNGRKSEGGEEPRPARSGSDDTTATRQQQAPASPARNGAEDGLAGLSLRDEKTRPRRDTGDTADSEIEPILNRQTFNEKTEKEDQDAARKEAEEAEESMRSAAALMIGSGALPVTEWTNIKEDLKEIIRMHSVLKINIEKGTTAASANSAANQSSGHDPSEQSVDPQERSKEETSFHAFFSDGAAHLFLVVSDAANRLMMGEITTAAGINEIIYNNFSISAPEYVSDRLAYERNLCRFLELNSNFMQQAGGADGHGLTPGQQQYSLQITNLSCVKQERYKNCFIRVVFDGQVRETPVRTASMIQHTTSWDGVLTFDHIASYENKVVEFQIFGYRLRALQSYREKLIGKVFINLSVLVQSSPYVADITPLHSAAAGTVNRKTFTKRMSMSDAPGSSPSGKAGGGGEDGNNTSSGSTTIIANHCAWFVVEKKATLLSNGKSSKNTGSGPNGAGGKNGSGTASGKDGSNGSSSVVRLLSSESVRTDIDDPQLRVGIKMVRIVNF